MNDITLIKDFIDRTLGNNIYQRLLTEINWQKRLRVIGDESRTKSIKRAMSYVSDLPTMYRYAGLELQGEIWTADLLLIKSKLEQQLNHQFNSVLLNLYENGRDEIRWHSDKEEQLGDNPVIACVNLGATRNFWFLEKNSGIKSPWSVSHGDLLVMGENCQRNYLHAILKEDAMESRISLTYRLVHPVSID